MLGRELTAPRVTAKTRGRGQLPRTRIGIVRRTRARHAVCAEGLHFSAFHLIAAAEIHFVVKMNMSVLVVLCLVTLSNVQLGQSQCDGEV